MVGRIDTPNGLIGRFYGEARGTASLQVIYVPIERNAHKMYKGLVGTETEASDWINKIKRVGQDALATYLSALGGRKSHLLWKCCLPKHH